MTDNTVSNSPEDFNQGKETSRFTAEAEDFVITRYEDQADPDEVASDEDTNN